MTPDIDVDKLFETHTVEEVKLELQKIRNTIEKKKEDLRVMVGERYRDLIEAADTIQLMETSAAGVCKEVAAVQQLCSSLQHRGLIGFKTTPSQQPKARTGAQQTLVAAAQVKVVVVASARIWAMLERGELLAATQLLLLTQHTHTALLLTRRSNQEDVVSRWPVLNRQWASVCQLPATISRLCRHTITAPSTSGALHHQRVCEAVVSLLLLQGDSLSATLHSVLHLLQDSLLRPLLTCDAHQTARSLITSFADRLVAALTLLHAVFAPDSDSGQSESAVEQKLQSVASGDGQSVATPLPAKLLGETEEFLQLLPPAVRSYRPRVRGDGAAGGSCLKRWELDEALGSWLVGVVDTAKLHLARLLDHCPSLQAVCAVRQSVWAALDRTPQEHWRKQVLSGLGLGSDWCVWQRVVRECVQQRARALLTQHLSSAVKRTLDGVTQLTHSILQNEKVASEEGGGAVQFVWSEAAGDLPDKVGWLSAAQRTLEQAGGLAYKSYGYTARTQAICSALDGQLAALRQDLEHMRCQDSEDVRAGATEDYDALLQLLQNDSRSGFTGLVGGIERLSEECCPPSVDSVSSEQSVVVDDPEDEDLTLMGGSPEEVWGRSGGSARLLRPHQTALVSLARLTLALTNICPNLQLCAIATALNSPDTVRRVSLGLPVECPGGSGADTWTSIKGALEAANTALLQRFLSTLTAALHTSLAHHLAQPLQLDLTATLLTSMALCDSVEVCDEAADSSAAEGSGPVMSSLRVPAQPSPALSRALHALCRRLSVATPHVLSRPFSSSVPSAVCGAVLAAYRDVVPLAATNQQLALHLLFDLKFIATVAMPTNDVNKSVSAELASLQKSLEASVDPFDLSVVQPHLNTRVRAAANRAQVILGCIYVRDRQHPATKLSSGAAAALPLVPVVDIPRFSNVPLPKSAISPALSMAAPVYSSPALHDSLSQSSTSVTASKQSSLEQRSTSGFSSTISAGAGARSASSIFSAMSSSWFGGTTSK